MGSIRILIADDHDMFRGKVRSLIESRGTWVVCDEAKDGREAVAKARELKPDVVVLDVSMPKMTGLDAARLILEAVPNCKILIVSQNEPSIMQREAARAGARGFIPKSNVARDLLPAIEALASSNGLAGNFAAENSSSAASQTGSRPTNFVQSETHLQRSERLDAEMLAAIVASSDDAIVSKDLNGVITSWNKSAERIFGWTAEEAIGQGIMLIIPADRQEEEVEILSRIRRGERVDHFETVRRRKDGRLLDVAVTISPLKDSNGKVIGASKVARDVTERRAAEEALRESEERLRALVNASSYVIYCMSPDWKDVRQLDGQTGVSESQRGSLNWLNEHVFEEDRPVVIQAMQEAIRDKKPFEMEHRVRAANGEIRWTLSRAVPRLNARGDIIEWFGAASDVTARKLAEKNYRDLVERLDAEVVARTKELEARSADVLRQSEQLRELSWQLLRTQEEERRHIARELHDSAGQVLAVLGMNLSMLVEQAKAKAPEIEKSAGTVLELVQQLTKEIRTTSYLLHPPLLDENGLPAALSWYVRGLVERSGMDITLNISEEFGRLSRDMELVIFRLVQECLTNIHRHSGSTSATIQVEREEERIVVEVRDQGRGIPKEKLAEIQQNGVGVGIRGMRERLRQFDGELMIASDATGTTVLVTIPLSNEWNTRTNISHGTAGGFKAAV